MCVPSYGRLKVGGNDRWNNMASQRRVSTSGKLGKLLRQYRARVNSQSEAIYPQRNIWQYQMYFSLCLLVWQSKEKTQWALGCRSHGC